MRVRRVVTGHKPDGKATVLIDEEIKDVMSYRPGATVWNIWSSALPADNADAGDGAKRIVGTAMKDRSVFRIVEYAPGVAPRNHRTETIDYGIVLSGELDMELDDGETVHLKAGDVVVQRGTIHNWINRGAKPCVVAFILIDAKPLTVGGKAAQAVG
jgi:quercetin dioxygenase-like cupin family protein